MRKLGEERARVLAVEPVERDGVPAVRVTVEFLSDAREEQVTLRRDLVPEGLAPGDAIEIAKAALYRRWTIRIVPNGEAG